MAIRPSDLSPAARKKLGLDDAGKPKKPPKKAGSTAFKGWCHKCGELIPTGAAMERHRDENEGHANFVCYPPTPPRSVP